MRITRIDIEGASGDGCYATIERKRDSDYIHVALVTRGNPDGFDHYVMADCDEDIWSMAECMQIALDGQRGTNSMIHDYYREVRRFAD
jgi:hypothetical protein